MLERVVKPILHDLLPLLVFCWVSIGLVGISVAQDNDQFCKDCPPSYDRQLNIGVLLSLSGGLEQWCIPIRQGMEIAVNEKHRRNINLIFEDDHSVDKRASLAATKRLLERHQVDILYTWTTSLAPMLIPVANSSKTPLLVGAYDPRSIHFGDYVFAGGVNYQIMPREIAKFLVSRGGRRFGVVMEEDHWSHGFEEPFRDELAKLGVEHVLTETLPVETTDTRSLILRLKRAGVDGVLAPLFGETLHSFVRTARELKFEGSIHVADGAFEGDIRIIGPAAEGIYASQIWLENEELLTKFRDQFGRTANPLQLGLVAGGYDFVHHIGKAVDDIARKRSEIQRSGQVLSLKDFRETLARSLMGSSSQGYLGTHSLSVPPLRALTSMVVVKNGQYRLVQ